ncbi:MAG: DUF421 domain-containing protein [Opitutales bacterium]
MVFFDDWLGLLRILVIGVCAYGSLLVLLRVSGKRTLSKMNAFDFVVTVALGSTLATILLSEGVALVEGVLALALLIGLQLAITWLSVRSAGVRQLVKAEPRLLYHRGQFLDAAMKAERVPREEILQTMRSQGIGDTACVMAVVLETDGSLSLITDKGGDGISALRNVRGMQGHV